MFRNFIKTAYRDVWRHKGYTFINIAGLATGMAVCVLIMLWAQDELSYDRFHKHAKTLYRVFSDYHDLKGADVWWATPPPLAKGLKAAYPEIKKAAMYSEHPGQWLVNADGKTFMEGGLAFAEPDFLEMFTLSLIKGDSVVALNSRNSIIITEAIARKYFGDRDPLGQTLQINKRFDFVVTGVTKDVPSNSHFKFRLLVPFPVVEDFWRTEGKVIDMNGWRQGGFVTYVMLADGVSWQHLDPKIRGFMKTVAQDSRVELYLQPITDVHLRSGHISPALIGQGDISYVYIFSVVAAFILVIACINFINLTTARSAERAKEVGVRKAIGAQRTELMRQFLGESVLMTLVSFSLAVCLTELLLPTFAELTGKAASLNLAANWTVMGSIMVILLLTGAVAGLYPAVVLSSFQPANALKGTLRMGGRGNLCRRGLVIIQFALSILLVVSTLVVSKQLRFMQAKQLGFDREHVLYLPNRGDLARHLGAFRDELLKDQAVLDVTASSSLPAQGRFALAPVNWPGKRPDELGTMGISSVDFDYTRTFRMEVLEGRSFSRKFPSDVNAVMLNEAALRMMGLQSPVGQKVDFLDGSYTVIGVLKDFHYMPMQEEIQPLVLTIQPDKFRYILIRVKPGATSELLPTIEKVWNRFAPGFPFEYHFLDEAYDRLYSSERRIGQVLAAFTLMAIAISCLGLFGLATFMAQQRTKEIGMRRILGASVTGVFLLLARRFVGWVMVSYIVALPIAYFVMHRWLQRYAYRTGLGATTFLLVAVLVIAVTTATVGYQIIRVAHANPIESLKYE